jgi:zinc and cadmium transporter
LSIWFFSLASVVAVSSVSLAGLLVLSADEQRTRRLARLLVSFAVGALLGDAFIHLIPEAFAGECELRASSLLVLAGVLLFFATEKLLRHRSSGPQTSIRARSSFPERAAINLAGDALHNFIDGIAIAASYLASPELGVATTAAVLLHELPQELADFAVLVDSGLPVGTAVSANLASASTAIAGAIATLLADSWLGHAATLGVPITAGGFLYIALASLIPELQRDRGLPAFLLQGGLIGLGIGLMAGLAFLE